MSNKIQTVLETADLDPGLAGFLAHSAAQGNPPIESLPPHIARQVYRDMANNLGAPAPDIGKVTDTSFQGPAGAVALRVYAPEGAMPALPVLLFLHGGGFVIGDLETHDKVCRTLCHHAQMLVVAVDYRLAPEYPFPAGPDDAEAALRWVLQNAGNWGGDASRIAIAGDSAGAQLSLVAARRVNSPAVRALGLIYPPAQNPDAPYPCREENDGKFLTLGVMQWFEACYTGNRVEVENHPDVALGKFHQFETLPNTWVGTMGHDSLRDEGHALAINVAKAQGAVTHQHYPSGMHACIHFTAISPVGLAVMTDLAQWLRKQV